jgi:hypothetical protein
MRGMFKSRMMALARPPRSRYPTPPPRPRLLKDAGACDEGTGGTRGSHPARQRDDVD